MEGSEQRIEAWRAQGAVERFRGYGIHVQRRPGEGPLLVMLHGFPSSSYDFRALLGQMPEANVLSFDLLGFGLSDKPRDHVYSLLWQADLAEALIERHRGDREIHLVAHDMGTSVATELLTRSQTGRLGFDPADVLLFNGSIVLAEASLTWVQQLLRSPLGPVAARLSNERLFAQQFSRLFSEAHPVEPDEVADQWRLISAQGGGRLGDRLIYYLGERERFADRWHGAISGWDGVLRFGWGLEDPVATTAVLAALRRLRPEAPVSEWPGLGHYPQIEAPGVVAEMVLTRT